MDGEARPRLCLGVAVVPTADGLVVEGGPRRQRFSGSSTPALRRLLPLVDGTRTPVDLVREAGLGAGDAEQILTLLHRCGLLEVVTRPVAEASAATAYFSRAIDGMPRYGSAEDLAAVLAEAAVVVVADRAVAGAIVHDLKACGVGTATTVDRLTDEDLKALPDTEHRLVVAQAGPGLVDVVSRCLDLRVEVLRFAAGPDRLEVGPRNRLTASDPGSSDDCGPGFRQILAGLVVAEALAILTRWAEPAAAAVVTTHEVPSLERHRYVCSDGPLTDAYEDMVASPLGTRPAPVADSYAEQQRLQSLKTVRPEYPTAPRVPLPPHADGGLAAVLSTVAGRQAVGGLRRFAPSGGNMGATELYLVAGYAIGGWPPGTLFRYDDLAHELVVPRADNDGFTAWTRDTPWSRQPPDVVLLFVSAVQRLAKKYGRFAYRLGHLDAGCALGQLAAVAPTLGLRAEVAPACHGAYAGRLELQPGHEFVAATAALYGEPADAVR